jgi:hypothetical protein
MVAVNFSIYGNLAAEIVARESPRWESWMQQRFPMPSEATSE